MNEASIKVIIQEKRYSDYVKVLNFIEINKCYELVSRPEFIDYLITVYDEFRDNSVLNLLLKADIDVSNIECQRSVIVLSPNLYSKYTLSVIEKLIAMGVTVEGIICVKFSLKRLWKELRNSYGDFFRKVFNKLVYRKGYYLDSLPTRFSDLSTLSRDLRIPLILVDSLNSASFKSRVKSMSSRLVVFTGGGIIHEKTFKGLPDKDFINCHSGFLPHYRGVDCNYWAIYNEDRDNVGVSCHFMTPLIDRGDIILSEKVFITPQIKTIKQLDVMVERKMVDTICNSVDLFFCDQITPKAQTFDNGSKYFKMDRSFMRKVEIRLLHED